MAFSWIPSGTRGGTTFLCVAIPMAVATACESGATGPAEYGDRLSESIVTSDYHFRFASGDAVDAAWQESYHRWLHETLALPPTPRVEYRKYRDVRHMHRITGFNGNGWSEPDDLVLHTVWARDNHEIVHVVVNHHLGIPPGLFSEGVAVAHQVDPQGRDRQPRWNGRPLHAIARELAVAGRLPDLEAVIETEGFARMDPEVSYPMAGSFVSFLLAEAGLPPFKSLARSSHHQDPVAKIREDFESAYGGPIDEWWARWLKLLSH